MATSSASSAAASKSAKIPLDELANPSLPTEIITDIFSRLPARFVFRMECLSKHYYSSLSKDPYFVEAHFRHSFRFRLSLIVRRPHGVSLIRSLSLIVRRPHGVSLIRTDGVKITEEKLTFPPCIKAPYNYGSVGILASCDGIVLLRFFSTCTLWYPATNTLIFLPSSSRSGYHPDGQSLNKYKAFWGFGYCVRTHDHKVVKITYYEHEGQKKFVPQVIGVNTDSVWRRVDVISGFETCSGPGISLNSVIYWKPIKQEGEYRILTFVLAEDKFVWISCPEFYARSMEKLWFLNIHWPLVPADIFRIHAFLGY